MHPHDLGTVDQLGIAVRTGHRGAQPLLEHLGLGPTTRASFALYNTHAEVERLLAERCACHKGAAMISETAAEIDLYKTVVMDPQGARAPLRNAGRTNTSSARPRTRNVVTNRWPWWSA